jgi:hypothetical protein
MPGWSTNCSHSLRGHKTGVCPNVKSRKQEMHTGARKNLYFPTNITCR